MLIPRAIRIASAVAMFAIGFLAAWFLLGDTNTAPTYGKTGLPKNCRAIVAANIDGWRTNSHTAEGALKSIDRNCGMLGHSWGR